LENFDNNRDINRARENIGKKVKIPAKTAYVTTNGRSISAKLIMGSHTFGSKEASSVARLMLSKPVESR